MRRLLLFVFASSLVLSACDGKESEKPEVDSAPIEESQVSINPDLVIGPDGWVEYDEKEYKVYAPADWEMDVTGRSNTTFILFSPRDSKNDIFRENVNLVKDNISAMDMTLFDYVKNSQKILEEYMTDLRDLNVEQKGDRYWLTFTTTQEGMDMYYIQMMELNDGIVYILMYSSNDESLSSHAENGKKIIERFQYQGINQ